MITINARNTNSLWKKTKGLLLTNKPETIYFETRWGIHTFGMRYPIDVIVLNQQDIVVVCRENLQPNHVFFWNPKYYKVLELPAGFCQKQHIAIGVPLAILCNL